MTNRYFGLRIGFLREMRVMAKAGGHCHAPKVV